MLIHLDDKIRIHSLYKYASFMGDRHLHVYAALIAFKCAVHYSVCPKKRRHQTRGGNCKVLTDFRKFLMVDYQYICSKVMIKDPLTSRLCCYITL